MFGRNGGGHGGSGSVFSGGGVLTIILLGGLGVLGLALLAGGMGRGGHRAGAGTRESGAIYDGGSRSG